MAASKSRDNPAPELTATELELKRRGRRRLIGAIVLGLLALVFLPMIFDREPKRLDAETKTQEIAVQVPAKDGLPALPAPAAAPVVVASAPDASKAAADATPAKVASPLAEPTTKQPAVVAKETPPPAAKVEKNVKPAKAEAASAAAKKGFVVQLGAFRDADKIRQVIDKMKEAKLPVYSEKVAIESGEATRVRVGPYATREKADAALAQIKLGGGDGKIIPLK